MVEPGDLLISHPRWAEESNGVYFVTENNPHSVVALQINQPTEYTIRDLVANRGLHCLEETCVYRGGDFNSSALVMLHDTHWFSSNTMQIDRRWSISSDNFMLDKISDGNTPTHYRYMIGVSAWDRDEFFHKQKSARAPFLVLKNAPTSLITADPKLQYNLALNSLSNRFTQQHFS